MGKLLLFLFTVVPALELYLLILVGRHVGFAATVGIVLATGMLGAALAKREGLRVVQKWQRELAEGRTPAEGVLGGLLVFAGGIFLITPGVLTDLFGLLMLIPPTRKLFARFVRSRLERGIQRGAVRVQGFGPGFGQAGGFQRYGAHWSQGADIVDVEGHEVPAEVPVLEPGSQHEAELED
ncbi:MAG: FxsA family protein [Myxococcota bacterium]